MESIIKDTLEKLQVIHEKAETMAASDSVPSPLKNEFKNKTEQFEDMFSDLEMMKSLTDKKESLDNLLDQELNVLKTRIKWEMDIVKRMMEYNR